MFRCAICLVTFTALFLTAAIALSQSMEAMKHEVALGESVPNDRTPRHAIHECSIIAACGRRTKSLSLSRLKYRTTAFVMFMFSPSDM